MNEANEAQRCGRRLAAGEFTGEDLALLMGAAYRWGYEKRVQEEDAGFTPVTFSAMEVIRDLERLAYRKECDRVAGQPRPTDYPGRRGDG